METLPDLLDGERGSHGRELWKADSTPFSMGLKRAGREHKEHRGQSTEEGVCAGMGQNRAGQDALCV